MSIPVLWILPIQRQIIFNQKSIPNSVQNVTVEAFVSTRMVYPNATVHRTIMENFVNCVSQIVSKTYVWLKACISDLNSLKISTLEIFSQFWFLFKRNLGIINLTLHLSDWAQITISIKSDRIIWYRHGDIKNLMMFSFLSGWFFYLINQNHWSCFFQLMNILSQIYTQM